MSCFDVQILDPNINTIEIETCIGDQPSSIVEVNHCIALLPSEINELIPVLDIIGGSGILVSSSSGLYTVSLSNPTISASGIVDLTEAVQDIIGNSGLLAGNYININYNDNTGFTTISATGLQPSGNYANAIHTHTSSDITDFNSSVSGLLPSVTGTGYVSSSFSNNLYTISVTGLQPSGNYSVDGHTHTSSNITDFNSSVSGLLPVKNISAGSGIGISSVSGDFTVSVTGTFGLTDEEVDDRVSNLLVGGNYVNLNYNDLGNSLIISVTGVQPSGNYSLIGHSHNTSDITDFNSGVSGLLPSVSGSGYIVSSFANNIYTLSASGLQPSGNYSVVGHSHVIADVSGLQNALDSKQPSGVYASGIHYHISSDITDFNSAVSGLIPPSNFTSLTGLSGIVVTNSGTNYFVTLSDPTIQLADITDLSSNARTFLLTPSSSNLNTLISDETGSGNLVFNNSPAFSGTPTVPTAPSGTNSTQIASTAFVRTEISNLIDSAPSTLDTLNELAAALGDDPNFATTIASGLGQKANLSGAIFTGSVTIPSGTGNFDSLTVGGVVVSISGHSHVTNDITNFNSSVSGLLPVKDILAGSGISVSSSSGIYTINADISGVITEVIQDNLGSGFLVAGTGVQLTYDDPANTLRLDNLHTEINELSLEPQGFVNRLDSVISFNDSTRTFTIAPSGASYDVYIEGIKVTKTTSESIVIPTGTALNYLHFNTDTGLLDNKTTGFNFDTDVPIAYIHWNADINQSTFFGEERHGIRMDSVTHKWIHNTFGIQYINGLSIGGYILLGNGSSNSHAQIDISDGVLYQEDIIIDITNDNGINSANEFVQTLNPIAYIPTYYHSGSTGQWVRDSATAFPVKYNGTRAQYNLFSGGTWTIPNVTNDRFFAMWIVATNDINDPILAIVGQREDSSLNSAESHNNWNDINLTNIPTQEIRPLYRLIFKTNSTYTNTPKSSLQSILDIRVAIQSTVAGVVQNDHGSLFGLADDDHSQYVHIDNNRTISALHTFSNGLNAGGLINAASGSFTSLTVNGTGVSLSGHTHTSSDITDFNSTVSGLLPSVSGIGYATTSFANNIYTVSVTGLQPSGNYSVVGHTHTSSNITDFNSSVSGLLPITNIVAGSNVTVSTSGTTYTISSSGTGGGGTTITNYGNNRLLTSDGTSTGIVAESGIVFNDSTKIVDITYDTSIGDSGNVPGLRITAYDTNTSATMGGRLIFRRFNGTESSPSGLLNNDTIGAIIYAAPNTSGIAETVGRILGSADGVLGGSNTSQPSKISIITSSGPSRLDNELTLESDGEVYTNGYITVDDGISAPTPVYSLGTVSGNTAISYDVDRQIQTVTLNGTSVNFTEGTGWTTANRSVDVVLQITVTSTTTVAFDSGFVTDWYNTSLPTFSSGVYLILLRSIGSTIIQGHYIGKKI
jgi:hypothetical protein